MRLSWQWVLSTSSAKPNMTLGQALREGRLRNSMSLRDVERATGISNGYLSQLESDAVKEPSPNHLYKLAQAYGIGYSLLMELAGYRVPEPAGDRRGLMGLDGVGDLTEGEWAQVRSFALFLRNSRRRSGEIKGISEV